MIIYSSGISLQYLLLLINSHIPHLNPFDYNSLKKSHGKGTHKQTDEQTDIATTRPNRPSGPIRWKYPNHLTRLDSTGASGIVLGTLSSITLALAPPPPQEPDLPGVRLFPRGPHLHGETCVGAVRLKGHHQGAATAHCSCMHRVTAHSPHTVAHLPPRAGWQCCGSTSPWPCPAPALKKSRNLIQVLVGEGDTRVVMKLGFAHVTTKLWHIWGCLAFSEFFLFIKSVPPQPNHILKIQWEIHFFTFLNTDRNAPKKNLDQ